jgi:hypothetical protein
MTPIITFTTGCGGATIGRLETRPGCMAAMAEIPRNRRRWVLPAALVAEITERVPWRFVVRQRRAGE